MQPNQPQHIPGLPPVEGGALTAVPQQAPGSAQQQAILSAKNLVLQYQQSPFQLTEELYKLKANYLAQEFNITTGTAEK